MEKENQRIAITKRLLKESLLELLQRKDIEKISVTELCQLAGINRATFYRHYAIPRDLLQEIEADIITQVRRNAPLPESAAGVKPYLESLFGYLYRSAAELRVLIRANTESEIIELLYALNETILRADLGTEGESILDDAEIRLLSAYLSGGGYHMLRAWLLEDIPISPQEIAQLFYDAMSRDLEAYIRRH